jgi:hypothetical protein
MSAIIAEAKRSPSWDARTRPFDFVLSHDGLLDPIGKPEQKVAQLTAVSAAGATIVTVRFEHKSRAHCIEQMEALVALQS